MICKLLIIVHCLVQLMYAVNLAEDLHPHPRAYVGYFPRYTILNWTY